MAKKILLVDDDVRFVEVLTTRLQSAGYEVISSYTGGGCQEKLKTEQPDLLLLDILLPDMSGYSLLTSMKDYIDINGPAAMTPTIIITGCSGDQVRHLLAEEHIKAYLTKPIDSTLLLKHIEAALHEQDKGLL